MASGYERLLMLCVVGGACHRLGCLRFGPVSVGANARLSIPWKFIWYPKLCIESCWVFTIRMHMIPERISFAPLAVAETDSLGDDVDT